MAEIKLYSYFRSSASYRVRVALNLKQLKYEYFPIHLVQNGGEQHSSIYKQLNPSGEVPCLIHDKVPLSQSMAIILFLNDTYPEPALFPLDPTAKAKVMQVCEMINSGVHPLQNLKVLQYLETKHSYQTKDKVEWAAHWITQGFQAVEKYLSTTAGNFCFDNSLTAADLFLVPQVYNAHRFKVDMNSFPTINRIEKNCLQLNAFQKAEPSNQPDSPKE